MAFDNVVIRSDVFKQLFLLLNDWRAVYDWWYSPNKAFANKTPDEMYTGTEEQRQQVIVYVKAHLSGEYQ